jgi:type VI secretion system protein ImpK
MSDKDRPLNPFGRGDRTIIRPNPGGRLPTPPSAPPPTYPASLPPGSAAPYPNPSPAGYPLPTPGAPYPAATPPPLPPTPGGYPVQAPAPPPPPYSPACDGRGVLVPGSVPPHPASGRASAISATATRRFMLRSFRCCQRRRS